MITSSVRRSGDRQRCVFGRGLDEFAGCLGLDCQGLTTRQEEAERRAAVGSTSNLDPTSMELDEGLDQAQSQADSPLTELVVSRGVMERIETGEEGLEQVLLLAGVNTDSFVLDHHADPLWVSFETLGLYPDRAAVGSELDGIGQQVDQDVHDLGRIRVNRTELRLDFHLHTLLTGFQVRG